MNHFQTYHESYEIGCCGESVSQSGKGSGKMKNEEFNDPV